MAAPNEGMEPYYWSTRHVPRRIQRLDRVLPCNVLLFTVLDSACVKRRNQHQPGITPNDNATHVPTAGSSAVLTKPNHTPT